MKYSFYLLILLLSLIVFISSTSIKLKEINHDSFKAYIESNKYNENKKLLLIFYKQNSTFSEEALNIIETDIIKQYFSETEIEFGKINIEEENNLWFVLQFNIKIIPYIILIKGNYFYELYQKPDKYSLKDFIIDSDKDNINKRKIPEDINTIRKILIIINLTIKFFRNGFYNIFKIRLNKNVIIFIFIIILCFILWILKKIISFICYRFCCKKIRWCKKKKKSKGEKRKNNIKEVKGIDIDKFSSGFSDDDMKDNENEDEGKDKDENMPEISNNLYNEEMSGEQIKQILNKYKKD